MDRGRWRGEAGNPAAAGRSTDPAIEVRFVALAVLTSAGAAAGLLALDASSPALAVPAVALAGLGWLTLSRDQRPGRRAAVLVAVAVVGGLVGGTLHRFQAPGADEMLATVRQDLSSVVEVEWSQVLDEGGLPWIGPVVESGGASTAGGDGGPSVQVAAALVGLGYDVEVLGPGELEQPDAGYPGPAWNVAASRGGIELLVGIDRDSATVQAWWSSPVVGRWPYGPVDVGRTDEPGVVSVADWFLSGLFETIVLYAASVVAACLVGGSLIAAWVGREMQRRQ